MAAAAGVEDDGDVDGEEAEVAETGYLDEKGELRRPWCPQTRILEHREMVRDSAGVGSPVTVHSTAGLVVEAGPGRDCVGPRMSAAWTVC